MSTTSPGRLGPRADELITEIRNWAAASHPDGAFQEVLVSKALIARRNEREADRVSESLDTVALSAAGSRRQALLHRMKSYVREHIGDHDLGPARVARAFGVSARYVAQLFREGQETPMDFIWRIRLERSKDLLAASLHDGSRIKEIAFQVGFKTHPHFTSAFVAEFGVSPKEYRDRLRRG